MKGRKPATIAPGTHPLTTAPRVPAWLSAPAKAEWRRVAPILVERGAITEADLGILATCCEAFGTIVETRRILARDGLVITSPSAMLKQHPALGSQNAAMATHRQLCAELGLTPFARSRASMNGGERDGDALRTVAA